jgi:antitoxin HicB
MQMTFRSEKMDKAQMYVVSDGRRILHLEPADEGGYTVTCPYDPALVTEAESIEEAFEMAEDAAKTLADGRAKLDAMRHSNGGLRRQSRRSDRPSTSSKARRKRNAKATAN